MCSLSFEASVMRLGDSGLWIAEFDHCITCDVHLAVIASG
jgi:hypothetical protein